MSLFGTLFNASVFKDLRIEKFTKLLEVLCVQSNRDVCTVIIDNPTAQPLPPWFSCGSFQLCQSNMTDFLMVYAMT